MYQNYTKRITVLILPYLMNLLVIVSLLTYLVQSYYIVKKINHLINVIALDVYNNVK